jgi:hypothetical protein
VGGFLVALSTFQGEFDFGAPQFRLLLQPVLIMLAAGTGLVAARLYLGRGGALFAAAGFLIIRGFITAMVGGAFGQTTPHFPLYLVEAALVELVVARVGVRRPVVTGALAGVAIGTVGLAAEWGWTHVWMPIPWPSELLPEAAALGFVTAVAAGAVGGFVGGALARVRPGRARAHAASRGQPGARPRPRPAPPTRAERRAALAGFLIVCAIVAWGVPMTTRGPAAASFALRDVRAGPQRNVQATIRVHPRDGLEHAEFANVTAWQGGGSVVAPLERVEPGLYRTTAPVPVHGSWKAMLRVQEGNGLVSVPLYLPEDRAIPARAVPARASFTRDFVLDRKNLQRERKQGVSPALTTVAYLAVVALAAGLALLLAAALVRLERGRPRPRSAGAVRPRRVVA